MNYQSTDKNILKLSGQSLKKVPRSILKNLNLIELDLSYNKLTELPEFITELKNLKILKLRGNNFEIAPELILQFKNLTTLTLSENQITVIPQSFRKLSKLKEFDFGDNPLVEFPEWIDRLSYLKDLGIYCLKLKQLPDVVTRLRYLEIISLDDNELTTLPDSIANLKYLKELWAEANNFEYIPDSFGKLTNLERINFGVNKIKYLPESICNFRRLKYLSVNENNIQQLPKNIGNLRTLEHLDISYNQLTTLPKSFSRLNIKNLEVWFDGNFYTEATKREIKRLFPNIDDSELELEESSPEEIPIEYKPTERKTSESNKNSKSLWIGIIIIGIIFIFMMYNLNKEDPLTKATKKASKEYNRVLAQYQKKRDKILKSNNSIFVYTNDTSELKVFITPNIEFYTNQYAPYYSNIESKKEALNEFLNDNSLGFNVVLDNKRVELIQAKILDSSFSKEAVKKYSLVVDYKMSEKEIKSKKKHYSLYLPERDTVFNSEKIVLTSKELEDRKRSTSLKQLLAPIIDLDNKEYHFYFSPYNNNNYTKQEFSKAVEDFKIMFLKENANKNIGVIKEIKIEIESP